MNVTKKYKENLTKFEKLALWINTYIGTIEFTVFCFVLVTIPIFRPETQTVIFYISSGYLQLILLPLIIMGGNLQTKHHEIVAEEQFEKLLKNEQKIEKILSLLEK